LKNRLPTLCVARASCLWVQRNDLRQLAMGLLWLHRNGMDALVEDRIASLRSVERSVGRVAR